MGELVGYAGSLFGAHVIPTSKVHRKSSFVHEDFQLNSSPKMRNVTGLQISVANTLI